MRVLQAEVRLLLTPFTVKALIDLGDGLQVEAVSEDGLVEALSIGGYETFGIGIQWHSEFHPERAENYINKILFKKFGMSCREFQLKRLRTAV